MSRESEIDKLLEIAKIQVSTRTAGVFIDQALALHRSKPKAGEFTELTKAAWPVDVSPDSQAWLHSKLQYACDLLDAKDEEIEKHRWIPVSERLPKQGSCLVLCEEKIYEVKIRVSEDEWEDNEGKSFLQATAHCDIEHLGSVLIGHDGCITHWKEALKETK